ncbi:unnamed protein product, partial [marine sediment metagenome]
QKADGSEAPSWNVEDGTADSLPAGTNGRFNVKTYTLSSSDFDLNDFIRLRIYNNDGASEPSAF